MIKDKYHECVFYLPSLCLILYKKYTNISHKMPQRKLPLTVAINGGGYERLEDAIEIE